MAPENWITDSNEALKVGLIRAAEDREVLTELEVDGVEEFYPGFTYPIFGEEEKIYGYRDLAIDFRLASGSLAQYLNISYSEKLPSSSTVDDVEGTLYKFIPPDYYKNEEDFDAKVAKDALEFKPYGEKIYSYKRNPTLGKGKGKGRAFIRMDAADGDGDDLDVSYEVYHTTWETPGFREYHRRMQIFILLYIEAGSYIEEDDERWEFVVLYEKRRRRDAQRTATYHFMGYSTLYPFYCFPERVRMRLSQFVILPPYQHKGHGASLYNAIYTHVLGESHIAELTCEDPAEAFEDLRDRCDMRLLLAHREFLSEALGVEVGTDGIAELSLVKGKARLGPPAEKGWVEKWRRELKMAGRQFHRLIEMLILKFIDPNDAKAMRAYRLQVKERIYKFNFEILSQLEKQERLEKLEETFRNVKEGYERILDMI